MSHRNGGVHHWIILAVIGCVIVLAAVLFPAVSQSREAARRMTCSSNLRQLGVAVLGYAYSYKKLPAQCVGYGLMNAERPTSAMPTAGRWSGIVGLIPFMEVAAVFNHIDAGFSVKTPNGDEIDYGPYGQRNGTSWATPGDLEYPVVSSRFGSLRCPSDPGNALWSTPRKPSLARISYAFNLGDSQVGQNRISIDQITTRGAFMRGRQLTLSDITDGEANTIMFGEIATTSRDLSSPMDSDQKKSRVQGVVYGELSPSIEEPLNGIDVKGCRATVQVGYYINVTGKQLYETRGVRWLDALACYTGFTTIIEPNGASCVRPAIRKAMGFSRPVVIISVAPTSSCLITP